MTLLTFKSKQFDIINEPRNDINPIFGHSLAEMLRQEFTKLGHDTYDEVENEDWGWYFYTTIGKQTYMVGTVAYVDVDSQSEEPIIDGMPIDFLVQFDKNRTFKEKLLGKNKFTPNEAIISKTETILKSKILDMQNYERNY